MNKNSLTTLKPLIDDALAPPYALRSNALNSSKHHSARVARSSAKRRKSART